MSLACHRQFDRVFVRANAAILDLLQQVTDALMGALLSQGKDLVYGMREHAAADAIDIGLQLRRSVRVAGEYGDRELAHTRLRQALYGILEEVVVCQPDEVTRV